MNNLKKITVAVSFVGMIATQGMQLIAHPCNAGNANRPVAPVVQVEAPANAAVQPEPVQPVKPEAYASGIYKMYSWIFGDKNVAKEAKKADAAVQPVVAAPVVATVAPVVAPVTEETKLHKAMKYAIRTAVLAGIVYGGYKFIPGGEKLGKGLASLMKGFKSQPSSFWESTKKGFRQDKANAVKWLAKAGSSLHAFQPNIDTMAQ